jgi:hypothetical protein
LVRVGLDVRPAARRRTVDTHPLCNAASKAAASDAFDAPAKIAFVSAFMTPSQMIEILRVIGARLAGDPKVGAKEGCTKPISNGYMRRFKRSRSIRAFFCC